MSSKELFRSVRQLRHMNVPALVDQERPDLVSKLRGKLHLERDVSNKQKRMLCHVGKDEERLQYQERRRERLQKRVDDSLAETCGLEESSSRIPYTNPQCIRWLDENHEWIRIF